MANITEEDGLFAFGELAKMLGLFGDFKYADDESKDRLSALGIQREEAQAGHEDSLGQLAQEQWQRGQDRAAVGYNQTGASAGAGLRSAIDDQTAADARQRMMDTQARQKALHDLQQNSIERERGANAVRFGLGFLGNALGAGNSMMENNWFGAADGKVTERGAAYRSRFK